MIGIFSVIVVGFLLGMRHATDPDHVIAVSTIVSGERNLRRAAWIGVSWGLGHTLTIFLVGSGIILAKLVIPPRLGLAMEFAVCVVLVVLGWMKLRRPSEGNGVVLQPALHSHPHPDGMASRWRMRALLVGIVHGLAGSAAAALLVLATIRDPYWATAYLLLFGAGTIAGMMLITLGIGSTFRMMQGAGLSRYLGTASGLVSLGFGLVVAYRICVVSGLFTGHPQWTPQ